MEQPTYIAPERKSFFREYFVPPLRSKRFSGRIFRRKIGTGSRADILFDQALTEALNPREQARDPEVGNRHDNEQSGDEIGYRKGFDSGNAETGHEYDDAAERRKIALHDGGDDIRDLLPQKK